MFDALLARFLHPADSRRGRSGHGLLRRLRTHGGVARCRPRQWCMDCRVCAYPGLPGLIGDASCSLYLFHPYVLKVFSKVFHVASKSVASEQSLPGASNVLLASHLFGAIPPSHPRGTLMLPETFVLTGVVHAAARLHRDHQ